MPPKPKLNSQQQQEVVQLGREGALKPRNATKDEIKIIARLSGRRTQRELAGFLGRSRRFVQEWQKKLGCQRKHQPTQEDKREIIRLYHHEKKGQAVTARLSRIPQKAVRATLLEAGIPIHPPGDYRFQMPPAQFAKFRRDVLSKRYYCADLAKKYSLSRHNSLRLAKDILGVEKFLRGQTFPPLSSVFPERQKHDERCTVADCMTILSRLFPGGLPPAADCVVASAVVDLLLELPFWKRASTPVLENVEKHLGTAAGMLRGAETALVN
jgi:hypothetical protein